MNIIIEKLKRVKKYGVAVFLAAASCFSGFGEGAMDCNTSEPYIGPDGKWYVTVTCIGTQFGTIEVEYEGGGGSCSGCTAMSPEECQQHKSNIASKVYDILAISLPDVSEYYDTVFNYINDTKSLLDSVKEDFDNYKSDMDWAIEDAWDSGKDDYAYGIGYALEGLTWYENLPPNLEGFEDSTYNAVDSLDYMLTSYDDKIQSIKDEVSSIGTYVSSMDCSPCSGGGDSGGGSGDSGGCPCKEVLEAIQQILTEHRDNVKKIKERLDGWDKYIKQIATSVNALAYMGTNFTYAVQYRTLDGISFQMQKLDEKLLSKKSLTFDYGEFGNLSWYSRIEYLLMSIAGVFSKTNREDTLTGSKLDSAYSDITDRKSTLQNSVNSIETKFGSLNTAVENLMSALSGAVGSGSASGQVTLWASWFGGRGLSMTIPSNVISTSRVVFSLLWTIMFSFTMYQIVLNGWVFIVKFIQFWITQTTGFLK